jgi:hypothetical protein
MSEDDNPAEDLSPAEQRLSEHLELLRASPPSAAAEMVVRIVRRARWQAAIREPMVLVGTVAAAIAESLGMLLKPPVGR